MNRRSGSSSGEGTGTILDNQCLVLRLLFYLLVELRDSVNGSLAELSKNEMR